MREKLRVHDRFEAALVAHEGPEVDFLEGDDEGGVRVVVLGVRVGADGAFEEEGLLRDGVEAGADLLAGEGGNVDAVDGDGGGRAKFEHAEEEGDEGALAAAAAAADADFLAGLDAHVEVADHEVGVGGV